MREAHGTGNSDCNGYSSRDGNSYRKPNCNCYGPAAGDTDA